MSSISPPFNPSKSKFPNQPPNPIPDTDPHLHNRPLHPSNHAPTRTRTRTCAPAPTPATLPLLLRIPADNLHTINRTQRQRDEIDVCALSAVIFGVSIVISIRGGGMRLPVGTGVAEICHFDVDVQGVEGFVLLGSGATGEFWEGERASF